MASAAIVAFVCSLLFLWPALLNRSPIVFSDTLGYFRAGEHAFQAVTSPFHAKAGAAVQAIAGPGVGIEARGQYFGPERSPYYGTAIVALFSLGGGWLVVWAQAVLAAATVLLAARRFGVSGAWNTPALLAVIVAVSGLSVFVSTIMPDLLTGLMLLALATLLAFDRALSRGEMVFLYLLTLLAEVSHVTHLALALSIGLAVGLWDLASRRRVRRSVVMVLVTVVLGVGANTAFAFAVKTVAHAPVVSKPFVLARLIGDGTAASYLKAHCGQSHFDLCRYLDRFPETDDDFLWSPDPKKGVFALANLEERKVINREANQIVIGTITEYPARQFGVSLMNSLRQFWTVGVANYDNMDMSKLAGIAPNSAFFPTAETYARLKAVRDAVPLASISAAMKAAYALSLLFLSVCAFRYLSASGAGPIQRLREGLTSPFGMAASIMALGVVANATLCGALAGIYDRYQGRVAWDATFFAVVAIIRWRAERRSS